MARNDPGGNRIPKLIGHDFVGPILVAMKRLIPACGAIVLGVSPVMYMRFPDSFAVVAIIFVARDITRQFVSIRMPWLVYDRHQMRPRGPK